jgi:hypothetical protein
LPFAFSPALAHRHLPVPSCLPQEHTFELGERAAVLYQLDQPAIVPHVAEVEGKKFPYEVGGARAVAPGGCGCSGWQQRGKRPRPAHPV